MNHRRLLDRFLRYVRIDTTAVPEAPHFPSSPGQIELGRLLVDELQAVGIADAAQNSLGIVTATVPASLQRPLPVIALCAHLDTSPEAPGNNVQPQVLIDYRGGDVPLPRTPHQVIRVAENPVLRSLVGQTLVTSDGTTLLGADDKAGVAVIVETAAFLMEHPEIIHGPIRLVFTCDEEVGRGVDHLDPAMIGAVACYTLDSEGTDRIDVETFSADEVEVVVRGRGIHPSIAKDRMVNAVRAAAAFLARLPRHHLSPESTEGRQGFLHPYTVHGGVQEVRLRVLVRDFDTGLLGHHADILRQAAEVTMAEFPGLSVTLTTRAQYRNLAEGLHKEPRAAAYAEEALRRLDRHPQRSIVRGGTDGARLTEKGLPTPNLSTGQHVPHSLTEWACLEEMAAACRGLVALAEVWAEGPPVLPTGEQVTPLPR